MKGTDRFRVEGVVCTVHDRTLPVVNLSVGGFFAATPMLPLVGDLLDLELALTERPPFRVTGKVVWTNEARGGRATHLPRGFGVKITRIALPDKVALLDFLKRAAPSRPNEPAASR